MNSTLSNPKKSETNLADFHQFITELAHRHTDEWYRVKDRMAHYDLDGVSFEITTGVIVAGRIKSNRGDILQPHA